jgi:DNA-directed RNA polymerase specialized sigma24 family protein
MFIPKGMTEEEVIAEINMAVRPMVSFKFGYYDIQDILQEGWIFALEALERYDVSTNVPLHKFLIIHLRNRFLNLHRNKRERRQTPCLHCPYWKKRKKVCGGFTDINECDKLIIWKKRNHSKRALVGTAEYFDDSEIFDNNPVTNSIDKELIKILNDRIPLNLRSDYCKVLDGVYVTKQKKEKLFECIKEILKDT